MKSIRIGYFFYIIFFLLIYPAPIFAGWIVIGSELHPSREAACQHWVDAYNNADNVMMIYTLKDIFYQNQYGGRYVCLVDVERKVPYSHLPPMIDRQALVAEYPTYCNMRGSCFNDDKNMGSIDCPSKVGNPCNASTGNKFQVEVDYQSNSLGFIRYYNSFTDSQSTLGNQWRHSYHGSLTIDDRIKVNRPDGKILEYKNLSDVWTPDADIKDTLTSVNTNWEYKTTDHTIETYNSDGQLLKIETIDRRITQYHYNNGQLELITDPYGRTLTFIYDNSNRLSTLTTPENTQIHYLYDELDNLVQVIYPDLTPNDLNDNPRKQYHYENTRYPRRLTGITDENNNRYATWAYNINGLAILSEHANSAEKVALVYNTDETTTVTDALGRIKTYTFETHYGLRKPTTIQYSYNDGKQLITKTKTYTYYPENGQVKEVTDYNGNITYFEYNERGLITLETQAMGTPDEYFISTTWHSEYRLPATRTYPDRTETYSYNSKGQLINTQITTIQ